MMSWKCQVVLLRWWGFLGLSLVAHALKKHYIIDYGDAMGRATVEVDEKTHLASISPFNSTKPATLMNFRKGITIYVTNTECLVSMLQTKEGDYKQQLVQKLNPSQNRAALYVMGSISPHRVRQLLGEEHYRFCSGKETLRLSHRRPRLTTHIFSIRPNDASKTPDQDSGGVGTEHQRYKRGAKKTKKDKSSKAQRGKDKKPKKDKKNKKKPKTKSLLSSTQQLNIKAPRILFPSAYTPHNLTDATTVLQGSSDHVVLQEEPYLSPSFIRNGDDGSGFRHYRDFHQESNPGNDTRSLGPIRHIISHDISVPGDGDTKILIPETIVKDGQIFYRYDADEGAVDATKGQSKRSHTREGDTMDEGAQFDAPFEYHNDSEDSPTGFLPSHERRISQEEAHFKTDYSMSSTPRFSHVHTQAQMGDGMRDASAAVLSDDGSGVHVQGNTDSEGFFVAQAQSVGHPGGRRTSLAHVFGNTHGVLGSAMTNGHGHQSRVQVDMGAHPSSTAHIATHDGSTLLTSSIRATQLGGRAGAQAYGDGASASDAQMEFNPSHSLLGGTGGLTGQGLASATVTKSGSSLLTSISGEAAGGSYLGTAQSSISHDPGFSPTGENATWEIHEDYGHPDGITHEFGHPDGITHEFGHPDELTGSSHHQDFIHGRHFTDHVPYHTEDIREIGSSSHSEGSSDQEHSDHASGHMIDNIMETVHQPDRQAEIIAYPVSEQSIIDEGGLVGGAGIPPRESEIGQTPLRDHDSLPEGRGVATGGSKAGIVGLATYSQGQVGAPPGPGELLNYPLPGSDKYDYNYYEGGYGSEYYTEEYDGEIHQDPRNLPFFDLGAHINGFQPIESNFENFEPMQLGLNGHPVVDPSSLSVDHFDQPVLVTHKYEEPDIQEITPDPPITVHQVQAPTLLPDDTQSSDAIVSHRSQESHEEEYSGDNDYYDHVSLPFPDSPTIVPYISTSQPHILISPHISSSSPTPHTTLPGRDSPSQHQSYLDEVISEHTGPHSDLPQKTHLPYRFPGVISGQQTISSSPISENDTFIPAVPQEVSRIHSSQFDTQRHTRPQSLPQQTIQQQGSQFDTQHHTRHQSLPQETIQQHSSQFDTQHHTRPQSLPQETIQQHGSQFDTQHHTRPQSLPQETIQQHSSQFDTQHHTRPQSLPQETIQQHGSQFDTQHHTRPQSLPQQTIQQQGIGGGMMMMMGIPLDPGNPGSIHYLPGNDGGPDLKVMSVAARQEHSLLSQRQRMFLQPGQKIPGAPGYKVPPGFRGHVILGENLLGTSESRRGVQGFSTHVRASPQSSFSGPIYTSVSGPDASQHIAEEGVPGVHVTLRGDDQPSPWGTGSDRSRTSQQVGQTHLAMRSQPISGSAPMTSRQPSGGTTPRKSWDGRRGGGPRSQKSWGTPGNIQRVGSDGECGYYSMNCQPAFGPNERDEICRPILITIGCCC